MSKPISTPRTDKALANTRTPLHTISNFARYLERENEKLKQQLFQLNTVFKEMEKQIDVWRIIKENNRKWRKGTIKRKL